MRRTLVKYLIVFLLLPVYINRGLFITPYETENCVNKEINTVIEWITEFVTGESNDIDEDGDLPSDYNSVKTVNITYYQEFAQYINLFNLHSECIEKIVFPNKENFYQKDFYTQIDHPPQLS